MRTPCTSCNCLTKRQEGHRTFIGCVDEVKRQGFKYDSFWYDHTCKNHEVKELCLKCKKYTNPYCENVYAECRFESK